MKILSKVYPSTPSSKAEKIDLIVDHGGEVCIYKSFHIYFLHRTSHPSPSLTTWFLSTWTQINVLVDRMANYWMLAKFNGLMIQMIFTPCWILHLQVSCCFVICNQYSYILEKSHQWPVRTRDGTWLAATIASDLMTDDLLYLLYKVFLTLVKLTLSASELLKNLSVMQKMETFLHQAVTTTLTVMLKWWWTMRSDYFELS